MVVRLYALYDRVAQEFSPIAEFRNDGLAYRAFKDALKDNPHADDFKPLFLGEYDKTKGWITPATLPSELEPGQLELELKPVVNDRG